MTSKIVTRYWLLLLFIIRKIYIFKILNMKVVINIYDIQPSCNQKGADFFGVGIYHSGIEINGQEWSFGGNTMIRTTGVYACYPK